MHRAWGYITLALSLAASSCGGYGSADAGTDPLVIGVTNGSFTASINGTAWSAIAKVIVSRPTSTSLTLFATSTTYAVNIVVLNVSGPGTFSLNSAPSNGNQAAISSTAGGWNSGNTGGTGSVVITTLTSSHVVGTFAFEGQPTSGTGATGTIHVTNGKFDLTF
jgi:hypothetical protein